MKRYYCKQCNGKLFIINSKTVCPKCSKLNILSKEKSLDISKKRAQYLEKMFWSFLSKHKKGALLVHFANWREELAYSFLEKVPLLETYKFLATNYLLIKIRDKVRFGSKDLNPVDSKRILELFAEFLRIKEETLKINEGFGLLAYKKRRYNLKKAKDLLSNFYLITSVDLKEIFKYYRDYGVYNSKEAEKVIAKYKAEYEKILKRPIKKIHYTPKSFFENDNFFRLLIQLDIAFGRNLLFAETLDFFYLKNKIEPSDLTRICNQIITKLKIPYKPPYPIGVHIKEFIGVLTNLFPKKYKELYNLLVVGDYNITSFPFFLEFGDMVIIFPRTCFLFYLFLHIFLHKELFDKKKNEVSYNFEREKMIDEFKSNGFKAKEIKTRSLQIDAVAWKGKTIYVTECKHWGIRHLMEHKRFHEYLERDLKGIVDGKKYTDRKPKEVVSLVEKVQYIKDNLNTYGLPKKAIVKGLIIVRDFYPIPKYKRVIIKNIKEINKLT